MKRLVMLIMFAIIFTGSLIANVQIEKNLKPGVYKLVIDNIKLDSFNFSNNNKMKIESKDKVKLTIKKEVITITANEETDIDLMLPGNSMYKFTTKDNSVCKFDAKQINIFGEDGEIITFNSEGLRVQDNGDDVKISKDGIRVLNDDETVSISSEGIIVKGGDDDVELTGFWGSILGSMIKGVVGSTMSIAINNPEKIIKSFINEEDSKFKGSWNNDTDSEYIEEKFEQSIPYKKNMKLTVLNYNGRVIIDTWDKKEINVVAIKKIRKSEKDYEKKLANAKIEMKAGKDIHIETKYIPSVMVSYTIMVPYGMKVDTIKSSNGKLVIRGLKNGSYNTTNGSIKVEDISGEFSLETTNGKILAENCSGTFFARTTNGSINVEDCYAVSGLYTSNGSINFDLLNIESDIEVITNNARIRCNLISNLDLKLNAKTTNGVISVNDFEFENVKSNSNHFYGEMNQAKHLLNLETTNGNIKIRKIYKEF
jgi:hypothetical protein